MKMDAFCLICFIVFSIFGCSFTTYSSSGEIARDTVMQDGMVITIENSDLTLSIRAGKGLLRHYTWNRRTRSISLIPRVKRWYGAFGAYSPGNDNDREEIDGISRVLASEAILRYESYEHLVCAISKKQDNCRENYYEYKDGDFDHSNTLPLALHTDEHGAYTDSGLYVSAKIVDGPDNHKTLYATVYRLTINGKPVNGLPGSSSGRIRIGDPKGQP